MRFVFVTGVLLGLFIPVSSQTLAVSKDAGRVIVVKTGQTYEVFNKNKFPLVQVTFGEAYGSMPYFRGKPPTGVIAPVGWKGNVVTEEESDRYFFMFEVEDKTHAIQPGKSLGGFGGFDAPVAGSQNPQSGSSVSPVPFEAVDTKSNQIFGVIVGP